MSKAMQNAPFMQTRFILLCLLWAAAVVSLENAVAQGQELDYRSPAGFVYEEASLTPEKARDLARKHAVLTLLKVTALSSEVAENLVTPYLDTFLTLPAVETIDADAAAKLSVRRGYLRLWGITSLTPETAAALVGSPGQRLELTGVRDISPEVAGALIHGKRDALGLGLPTLPTAIAEILAKFPGELWFPHLETLSREAAGALRKHRAAIELGPARISAEVAETLLDHDAPIGLRRVRKLAPGVGDILAKHKAEVCLALEEIDSVSLARKLFTEPEASSSVHRLRTMSPAIAAEYARHEPGGLDSLDLLTAEAARELAQCKRDTIFYAITQLSPELATALTDRKQAVYLPGLKALDGPDAVRVAEALARTPAPVYIEFLERISAPALAALRKKATITIPPDEKLTIVP
ncbi:MAG: hypothetical protein ACK5SI_13935 [Planctomycetia bacterium]|jgi:hypothetical protein